MNKEELKKQISIMRDCLSTMEKSLELLETKEEPPKKKGAFSYPDPTPQGGNKHIFETMPNIPTDNVRSHILQENDFKKFNG